MTDSTHVAAQLDGLDHIVLAVADLGTAAQVWRDCGFTVSPRGLHSDYLGTANHTVMVQDDYVELLGVLKPTEFNQPTRDFLAGGEGLERLAMRARDTEAATALLRAEGRAVEGPFAFSRPVDLPGRPDAVAAFHIFQWPSECAVEGARLFACQHMTRDTVWLPELTRHDNTATAMLRVERRSPRPEDAARAHAAVIGSAPEPVAGGWRIPAAPRGAAVDYLAPDAFAARWGALAPGGPDCGVVFAVSDRDAAARFATVLPDAADRRLVAAVPGALIAFAT